ncbi:MAG: superoxide dismutase [Simkaniaceae bacterium]|nr:MAG: superoxide dismutase [Simkaniaceae bacterium]
MKKYFYIVFIFLMSGLIAGPYQVKDYSDLLGRLQGISDPLLKMHFTLYQGYVKNTNLLEDSLAEMRKGGEDKTIAYGALKRRFGWEYDGMVLHELYFQNLGREKDLSSKSLLYQKIVKDFGSFENWRKDFLATGMIRGIGWVILYQDSTNGILHNVWVDEHNINHLAGGNPLLVMDVWEHAYITEYGLNRGAYLDSFYNNINWDIVQQRLVH